MKKLVLITIMFAVGFTVNAQDVKFGAKAGLNVASLSGNDQEGMKNGSRISFHIGGMVEIPLSDSFSVQPELLYSAQGATLTGELVGTDIDATAKFDYVTLPIMAKYYIVEGLSLEAGPQLALNIAAKTKTKLGDVESTVDFKDETEGFDFGVNFGAGYKLENGLNFGARYNLGLSDIAKDNEGNDAVKNGVFQISVGFFF